MPITSFEYNLGGAIPWGLQLFQSDRRRKARRRRTSTIDEWVHAQVENARNIQQGEQVGYEDWSPGVPTWNRTGEGVVIGGVRYPIPTATRSGIPTIRTGPSASIPAWPTVDQPVPVQGPGVEPAPQVYEIPSPEEAESGQLPDLGYDSEWDEPASEAEAEMAVDWGEFISSTAQDFISGFVGGGGGTPPIMGTGPAATPPPAKVTVDTRTGAVTPCRRRRRRRLLTNSDYNDLVRIGTLPNKEAVRIALAKAVK